MSSKKLVEPRRQFLRLSLSALPAMALSACTGHTPDGLRVADGTGDNDAAHYPPAYFTPAEWAFINAAVDRLIPADERGPGGVEAGVPRYIDRQMATTYAHGGLWYMQGPFRPDSAPELGYQLKLSPRELYRVGIADADAWCHRQHGHDFHALTPALQDNALSAFEHGHADFPTVPSETFFTLLLGNVKEGFFSDPVHGGNRDMAGWKLIGFPGARADFMDWVQRDAAYPLPPVSIHGSRG